MGQKSRLQGRTTQKKKGFQRVTLWGLTFLAFTPLAKRHITHNTPQTHTHTPRVHHMPAAHTAEPLQQRQQTKTPASIQSNQLSFFFHPTQHHLPPLSPSHDTYETVTLNLFLNRRVRWTRLPKHRIAHAQTKHSTPCNIYPPRSSLDGLHLCVDFPRLNRFEK